MYGRSETEQSVPSGTLVRVTLTSEPDVEAPAPRRRRLVRAVTAVLVLGVVVVAAAGTFAVSHVVLAARSDDQAPTDAIVVLGAAQFWGRPSPVLEARLEHAQDLYDGSVASRIVTVGGNRPGDITTEAETGKQYLVAAGVPASSVTALPTGDDTLSSLTAVARLMAARGWTSATLVTDPAHQARSLAMARALGIEAHGSPTRSGSGSSLTPDYVARESSGLLFFWVAERRGVPSLVGT